MRMTRDDLQKLGPAARAEIQRQLDTDNRKAAPFQEQLARAARGLPPTPPPARTAVQVQQPEPRTTAKRMPREIKQTEAEKAFNREWLDNRGRFEALTIRTTAGRYTPDFYLAIPEEHATWIVEVKGGRRLGSHGRAFSAWRAAQAAHPEWRFIWAERWQDGSWKGDPDELHALWLAVGRLRAREAARTFDPARPVVGREQPAVAAAAACGREGAQDERVEGGGPPPAWGLRGSSREAPQRAQLRKNTMILLPDNRTISHNTPGGQR